MWPKQYGVVAAEGRGARWVFWMVCIDGTEGVEVGKAHMWVIVVERFLLTVVPIEAELRRYLRTLCHMARSIVSYGSLN